MPSEHVHGTDALLLIVIEIALLLLSLVVILFESLAKELSETGGLTFSVVHQLYEGTHKDG